MSSEWNRLPVSHALPLLVKRDISTSAYTIQVTDLTHLWIESLDRRQIIRRAFDENVSIDPSEGPGQLMKLLQEIEKALKGQPKTSLKLQSIAAHTSITLEATVVLPSPLPLLVWCFHLSCASQEILTSTFLLPCIYELLSAKSEVDSLLAHLKEKDHVINRLTEKLESAGIELTVVFPSAAPPRRSKTNARELVMASVRGLNEFNIQNWRNGVKIATGNTDIESICSQLFETGSSTVHDLPNRPHDNVRSDELETESSTKPQKDIVESLSLRGFTNDVEGFQAGSPRRAKETIVDQTKRQTSQTRESNAAESTRQHGQRAVSDSTVSGSETSDDDLEGPVTQEHKDTESKPVLMPNTPKKLGILGGKRQQASQIPPQTARSPSIAGEGEFPKRIAGQLEDNMSPLATADKARPKLGMIGGLQKKGKLPETEPGAQRPLSSANIKGDGPSSVVDNGRSRRQSLKTSASPPPARETSMERADRNRARIKRELEEKNKVPAKKKRKF
ncbi:hypothetical protein MMC26_000507 [Xylographa opegraphella]|nr:hypothetical protein [Xylographa opegraphella]